MNFYLHVTFTYLKKIKGDNPFSIYSNLSDKTKFCEALAKNSPDCKVEWKNECEADDYSSDEFVGRDGESDSYNSEDEARLYRLLRSGGDSSDSDMDYF